MRGRGQFQFTVVELLVLAASFAATSAMVFLLGIYVGRDVAAQHAPMDDRVARLPIQQEAPIVVATRPRGATDATEVPVPHVPAPPAPPAPVEAKAKRPEQEPKPLRPVKVAPAPARPVPPPPAQVAVVAPRPAPTAKPYERQRREAYTARSAAQPPTQARPPQASNRTLILTDEPVRANPQTASRAYGYPRRDPPPPPAPTRRPEPAPQARSAGPAYTVQVLSTRDPGAAEQLARSLNSRGFRAYVRPAQDSTGRWYRVRIGRFDELGAARAMASRARSQLSLDQAYVISD